MLCLLCDVRDIYILLSISLFADDVCHSIIRSTIDRGYNRYLLFTLLLLSPSLSSSHFVSSLSLSLSPLTLSLFFFLSLSLSLSFLLSLFLLSHTLLLALSLLSLVCNISFPSPSLLQIPLKSTYSITIDFQIYGIKELKKCGLRRTNQEVYLPSTLK